MSEEEKKLQVKEEGGGTGAAPLEYINLVVKEQSGNEVHFKIKKKTQFKKLMDAYCQRMGLETNGLRFVYDGTPLSPEGKPLDLDMEDGDVIDVMQQQVGGDLSA